MGNYTFVMLKPDAIRRNLVSNIIDVFKLNNYVIEIFDFQYASSEKIHKHYSEKISLEGESFKTKSTNTFNGKPVIPMILSSKSSNIIAEVRLLIGATDPSKADKNSIRGRWAADKMEISERENRCCENLIHASDSLNSFKKEISIWFNEGIAERFLK